MSNKKPVVTRSILNYSYIKTQVITRLVVILLAVQKNTGNRDTKVLKTKYGRTMLSLKCAVYGSKKTRFVKEQEAKETLSNLGLKTSFKQDSIIWWHFVLILLFEFIKCNALIVVSSKKWMK